MVAIVGAVLGFLGSWLPEGIKLFREKKDREHELTILHFQLETQKQGHVQRLEEINAQADINESQALYKSAEPVGIGWVDALNASVRPVVTYSFFFLYAVVKYAQAYAFSGNTANFIQSLAMTWTPEDMGIFSAIMGFWFGQRSMKHFMGRGK